MWYFRIKYRLIYYLTFCYINYSYSQTDNPPIVTGNLSGMTSIYDFTSSDSLMMPRQNRIGYFLTGSLILNLHRKLSIPLSFSIMNNQLNAYYALPKLSLSKKLFHPSSILSLSPTFSWGTVYLGSHVPQVSKLLAGEIQIFGAGFDINPGIFRIASSYGVSEIEIVPDTIKGIKGSFKREYQTIKTGIGRRDRSGFYINFVRFKDIVKSKQSSLGSLIPKEGYGLGTDLELKLNSKLKFIIDGGMTFYTDNQFSEILEASTFPRLFSYFITPRKSSFLDFAGISTLNYNTKNFGFGVNTQYIGAGFKTPGFPNRPSDLIDLTSSIRFSLLKNKLNFNGTTGLRKDNLSKTKSSTNNSLLINASLNIIITKSLSLNSSYSNFGIERVELNDSIHLSTISTNLILNPSINFKTGQYSHSFNLSFTKNQSENLNLVTSKLSLNNITTFNSLYQLRIKLVNLSINVLRTYNKQNNSLLQITGLNFLPGVILLDKKLKIGLGLNCTFTESNNRNDHRKTILLRSSYKVSNGINLSLNGNINSVVTKINSINNYFSESTLQFGITYNFGIKKDILKSSKNELRKTRIKGQNAEPFKLADSKEKEENLNQPIHQEPQPQQLEQIKEMNFNENLSEPNGQVVTSLVSSIDSSEEFSKLKYDTSIIDKISNNNNFINKLGSDTQSEELNKNKTEVKLTKQQNLKLNKTFDADLENEDKLKDKLLIRDSITYNRINEKGDSEDLQVVAGKRISKDSISLILLKTLNKQNEADSFYIQLGATKNRKNPALIFKSTKLRIDTKYESGLYKYLIYAGMTYADAKLKLELIKSQGLKDSFIVKYRNSIRVNIND